MKNIKVVLPGLIMMMAALSCKKAITEEPHGFLNDKTLFNTAAGANAAMIGAYERISTYYYFGNQLPQMLSFASGAFWPSVLTNQPLARMAAQPNDALIVRPWNEAYTAINSVNGLIDGMLESPLTGNTKTEILGE